MTYHYRNRNTEQVVVVDKRDPRLDHLSYRWELLDSADHTQREAVEKAEREEELAEQRAAESAVAVEANQRLADETGQGDPTALSATPPAPEPEPEPAPSPRRGRRPT